MADADRVGPDVERVAVEAQAAATSEQPDRRSSPGRRAYDNLQAKEESARPIILYGWMMALTIFLVIFALNLNSGNKQRRDQACTIFERQQVQNVKTLTQTYGFLLSLSPTQIQDPLNELILRNVPQTEATARTDPSPAYCDDEGIGLPEPDPKVPPRPKVIDKLLKALPPPHKSTGGVPPAKAGS